MLLNPHGFKLKDINSDHHGRLLSTCRESAKVDCSRHTKLCVYNQSDFRLYPPIGCRKRIISVVTKAEELVVFSSRSRCNFMQFSANFYCLMAFVCLQDI